MLLPQLPHKKQYQHMGAGLWINSKNPLCLHSDVGPTCLHDLDVYLHLIDGFMGMEHRD